MTGPDVALIITSLGTFATALGGAIVSLRNSRKIEAVDIKVEKVHESTNGLTKRLESSAKKLGIEIGKAEEKANPTP